MNKSEQNTQSSSSTVVCCGVFELMDLGWVKLEDGTRCIPYINGHSDENIS